MRCHPSEAGGETYCDKRTFGEDIGAHLLPPGHEMTWPFLVPSVTCVTLSRFSQGSCDPSPNTPTRDAVRLWTALGPGSAVWQQHDARCEPWGWRLGLGPCCRSRANWGWAPAAAAMPTGAGPLLLQHPGTVRCWGQPSAAPSPYGEHRVVPSQKHQGVGAQGGPGQGAAWGRRERRDGRCARRGVAPFSPARPGQPYPVRPVESAPGTADSRHQTTAAVPPDCVACTLQRAEQRPQRRPVQVKPPLPPAPRRSKKPHRRAQGPSGECWFPFLPL